MPVSPTSLLRAGIVTWRLLRLDLGAADALGRSPRDALASFVVLPVLIPMLVWSGWPDSDRVFDVFGLTALTYTLIVMLQYLITMLSFYLIVARLTLRIGIPERLPHYITVQNWVGLVVWIGLGLPVFLLRQLELPSPLPDVLDVLTSAFTLVMSWLVTVATLRLRHLPAFALCMLELLFGQLMQYVLGIILVLTLKFS